LNPGVGSQHVTFSVYAHAFSLSWFALTRALLLLPPVAIRAAKLFSQRRTNYKAVGMRLFLFDVPLFMYIVAALASSVNWVVFLYSHGNEHEISALSKLPVMLHIIHSNSMIVFVVVLANWHAYLMSANAEPQSLQLHGTPQDIVGRLETCTCNEGIFGDEESRFHPEVCIICLGAWEPLDRIKVTPCHHAFHEDCLVSWLKTASTCVLCRQDLCKPAENRNSCSIDHPPVAPNSHDDPFVVTAVANHLRV